MADMKLTFHLILKSGAKMEQTINVPDVMPDGSKTSPELIIMQMLQQYATVGMLKKDSANSKFILVTCGMIDTVEVDMPSVLLANPNEVAQVSKGKVSLT
jgi:hypothetical protein